MGKCVICSGDFLQRNQNDPVPQHIQKERKKQLRTFCNIIGIDNFDLQDKKGWNPFCSGCETAISYLTHLVSLKTDLDQEVLELQKKICQKLKQLEETEMSIGGAVGDVKAKVFGSTGSANSYPLEEVKIKDEEFMASSSNVVKDFKGVIRVSSKSNNSNPSKGQKSSNAQAILEAPATVKAKLKYPTLSTLRNLEIAAIAGVDIKPVTISLTPCNANPNENKGPHKNKPKKDCPAPLITQKEAHAKDTSQRSTTKADGKTQEGALTDTLKVTPTKKTDVKSLLRENIISKQQSLSEAGSLGQVADVPSSTGAATPAKRGPGRPRKIKKNVEMAILSMGPSPEKSGPHTMRKQQIVFRQELPTVENPESVTSLLPNSKNGSRKRRRKRKSKTTGTTIKWGSSNYSNNNNPASPFEAAVAVPPESPMIIPIKTDENGIGIVQPRKPGRPRTRPIVIKKPKVIKPRKIKIPGRGPGRPRKNPEEGKGKIKISDSLFTTMFRRKEIPSQEASRDPNQQNEGSTKSKSNLGKMLDVRPGRVLGSGNTTKYSYCLIKDPTLTKWEKTKLGANGLGPEKVHNDLTDTTDGIELKSNRTDGLWDENVANEQARFYGIVGFESTVAMEININGDKDEKEMQMNQIPSFEQIPPHSPLPIGALIYDAMDDDQEMVDTEQEDPLSSIGLVENEIFYANSVDATEDSLEVESQRIEVENGMMTMIPVATILEMKEEP